MLAAGVNVSKISSTRTAFIIAFENNTATDCEIKKKGDQKKQRGNEYHKKCNYFLTSIKLKPPGSVSSNLHPDCSPSTAVRSMPSHE
jgi:hypothetical protein